MCIIKKGLYVPTFHETNYGVGGVTKRTPTHAYIKDDKKLINLYVRVHATIEICFSYDIYHLF